jgi:hypothetical protein
MLSMPSSWTSTTRSKKSLVVGYWWLVGRSQYPVTNN